MTDPFASQQHREADAALARRDLVAASNALTNLVSAAPDDFDAWMKLAMVRRGQRNISGALKALNEALRIKPLFYLPLLLKGNLLELTQDMARAAELYQAALVHAPDKAELPDGVAAQLASARAFSERYVASSRTVIDAALDDALGPLSPAERKLADRFTDNILQRHTAFHQEPTHYRYPGLADVAFFDDYDPGLISRLGAIMPVIREEFDALLQSEAAMLVPYVDFLPGQPMGQWADLHGSRSWSAIHLIRYGEKVEVNARHCPRTIAFFSSLPQPDLPGLAPNLMFSLLAPRTRIPPHHGVANFRAVLHLPLIVPAGCAFRVGEETRHWKPGKAWVFDDTIEHEAWNDSDTLRVVLIADMWRPELTARQRDLVRVTMNSLSSERHVGAL